MHWEGCKDSYYLGNELVTYPFKKWEKNFVLECENLKNIIFFLIITLRHKRKEVMEQISTAFL